MLRREVDKLNDELDNKSIFIKKLMKENMSLTSETEGLKGMLKNKEAELSKQIEAFKETQDILTQKVQNIPD